MFPYTLRPCPIAITANWWDNYHPLDNALLSHCTFSKHGGYYNGNCEVVEGIRSHPMINAVYLEADLPDG